MRPIFLLAGALFAVAACAQELQPLPPGMVRSKVPARQRVEAMSKLKKMLQEDGKLHAQSKKAAVNLENYGMICEPLAADQTGVVTRVLAVGKKPDKKHQLVIVPLFSGDTVVSPEIEEFLKAGKKAIVGFDGPNMFINMDLVKEKKALGMIAGAINNASQEVKDH